MQKEKEKKPNDLDERKTTDNKFSLQNKIHEYSNTYKIYVILLKTLINPNKV